MPAYFVHWNTIVKRVRIHRSECGACNGGKGMHKGKIKAGRGLTYDWVPAKTYAEACEVVGALKISKPALKKYSRTECGLCRPSRQI
jgi:hypothetical protein